MVTKAQTATLREGGIYVDLDGTLVHLVRIIGDVCCWVPVGKDWNHRQQTLASYFVKRFRFDKRATARHGRKVAHSAALRKIGTGHGTYILNLHEAHGAPVEQYRVGERVPKSGHYCAVHDIDDVATEVTLYSGTVFPPCSRCGVEVHFEFVADIPRYMEHRDFRIQVYEIPHPETGNSAGSEHAA